MILAAGVGSRFGGPKQLSPAGPSGETLLDYAIYDAMRAGFRRVVFVIRPELGDALRAHVSHVAGGAVLVDYVEQRIPEGRAKPFGTGHAVLSTRDAVDGPFAVCNADDYYGPGAYRLLAEHLTSAASSEHALVGYRLDTTLSEHGGVARAIASCGPDGLVTRLVEVRVTGLGLGIRGSGRAGEQFEFTGAERVSMNLWGFTPGIFAALEQQFAGFLAAPDRPPDTEFLLSTALDEQVTTGRARWRLLPAPPSDRGLGMTFAADLPAVRAGLAALVRAGTYPADLRAAFARL